jgi:uncharacterized protein YegL
MKNRKYLLFVLLLIPIIILIGSSLAANFDREIKNIEITSQNYPEPGSYHIDKSAKWIENGKAQVTFNIKPVLNLEDNYKDVILVIDVSGSMSGDKIYKVKQDATELVDVLLDDSHNRVALIEFESLSKIDLDFTNDKNKVIDKINNMYVYDCTNYNAALNDVDTILKNYRKEENRSLTLMFLTDGYPNEDTDNQIATYHLLKEKYPYMAINGIQYEMGTGIIQAIKDISDNQWSAFISTLHNVLFEAALSPKIYNEYILTDYINDEYFYLKSIDDVEVNMGKVNLEVENGVQKITWDLSEVLTTASRAQMNIKLSLKDNFMNKEGFFPTNKRETIVSKLEEENEENINSEKTPVLKGKYNVIYNTNTPSGCTVSSIETKQYFPFTNVTMNNTELKCEGFNFRGWSLKEVDKEGLVQINDEVFIMPPHDVTFVAIWEKIEPYKTMNGEVKQNANTLFDVMRLSAVPDDRPSQYVTGENGIDFTQQASDTNGKGVYELRNKMVVSDAENVPIYYFRGQVNNDFVLFGGYCWQIVRTTPNKGVKLIFFGEPTGENKNQCNSSRKYLYVEENWLPDPKYFNSSYDNYVLGIRGGFVEDGGTKTYGGWMINQSIYDRVEFQKTVEYQKRFYIFEDDYASSYSHYFANSYTYDEETGKYQLVNPILISGNSSSTVGKYTLDSTTSSYQSTELKYVVGLHNNSNYTYAYNLILQNNVPLETYKHAYVGTGLIENSDGTYRLTNTEVVDVTRWNEVASNHMNKYICDTMTDTCKNPMYITRYTDWRGDISYVDAKEKIYVSKTYDGTNMINPISIRVPDFLYNSAYSTYNYMCEENRRDCPKDKLFYISRSSETTYGYLHRYYGKSITYDGEYYHLVDYIGENEFATSDNNISNKLAQYHYFCPGYGETKCKNARYAVSPGGYFSLKLENGIVNPVEVFNKRKEVKVDANKNPINGSYDSNYKVIIDSFYEAKLMDYDKYIDDAVWCNSRVATNDAYQNSYLGGNSYSYLYYDTAYRLFYSVGVNHPNYRHPVIKCEDKLDAYTVNDKVHGNGFLKHPIALITGDEFILSGLSNSDSYIGEGDSYWYTMTPVYTYAYNYDSHTEGYLFQEGWNLQSYGTVSRYVKPSIVLKPSIPILSGDGTKDNPYQLELD